MKICVYGAGAVGGLIAGRLARSGHEVSVVARGAHLEAIRGRGLRVREGAAGAVESHAVRAEADPATLGAQDYVIVAVKAQGLSEVAERIVPLVGAGTSIITAMLGLYHGHKKARLWRRLLSDADRLRPNRPELLLEALDVVEAPGYREFTAAATELTDRP